MEQYAEVVLDLEGNAVPGATVQVVNAAGGAASIFDKSGNQIQGNTLTTGSRGEFAFQAPNGKYTLNVTVRGTVYATVGPVTFYDPADDQERATFSQVEQALAPIRAKILTPEDYFIAGDSSWSNAFDRAISSIPNGGSGILRLSPGAQYSLSTRVDVINRRIVLEGNNATITASANMNYALYVEGENCELRNFSLNRSSGANLTAGVFLKGLQHVVNNITSRDQKWVNFIHMRELKESKFSKMDVQIDVSGKTGNIFLMDYCVNNTIDKCFFGFCDTMFKGTNATHPSSGYSNEGLGVTNVQCVYARKAVDCVRMTAMNVGSGCIFDFCETWGIFITNGHSLTVSPGVWIASNDTNDFIGVGTGPTFDNARVMGVDFVRNAPISGAMAFSLPGTNSTVVYNRLINGINSGVVTQPATPISLLGNSVDSPGLELELEGFKTGAWAPVLSFGGASDGISFSARTAKYVKIGNKVDVEFYISLSNKGTSSGPAVISGLPFNSDATANLFVGISGYLNGVMGAGALSAYVSPGTKNISLNFAGTTGVTALTNANFTNSTEVSMSFSYVVA